MRPEHFLFIAVPVVSCRCSPAGLGVVCRDHPEPGQREAVRRVRSCIYTEIQPGEILPGLRGADAPEARGRKAAEKILGAIREMSCTTGRFFSKDAIN